MTFNQLKAATVAQLRAIVTGSASQAERRKAADALIVFHGDYTYVDQAVA